MFMKVVSHLSMNARSEGANLEAADVSVQVLPGPTVGINSFVAGAGGLGARDPSAGRKVVAEPHFGRGVAERLEQSKIGTRL